MRTSQHEMEQAARQYPVETDLLGPTTRAHLAEVEEVLTALNENGHTLDVNTVMSALEARFTDLGKQGGLRVSEQPGGINFSGVPNT